MSQSFNRKFKPRIQLDISAEKLEELIDDEDNNYFRE